MLSPSIVTVADAYWASHLGFPGDQLFAEPLNIITHGEGLSDYRGAFALFRNEAAIASVPPTCVDKLKVLLSPVLSGCSPESLLQRWPPLLRWSLVPPTSAMQRQ
jgi:hypothetical protein